MDKRKLKGIDGLEFLSDQPDEFDNISTSIPALNRIISGSYFKGVPGHKTTALIGPPNSGKSFVLANLCREAQKEGYLPLICDTERAVEKNYYLRLGVDPEKFMILKASSVEQARNRIDGAVRKLMERKPDLKLFLGLDSLGNVPSRKELKDAEDDKDATDMGVRAKAISSFFRVVNSLISEFDIPFVFVNHQYVDPQTGQPKQSGGKKPTYNAHIIISFVSKKPKKGDLVTPEDGIRMKATTVKNRDVPEGQDCEVQVSYREGIYKYSGLMNDAVDKGFIEQSGSWYTYTDGDGNEKRVQGKSSILVDNEAWEDILPRMDKVSIEENSYSCYSDDDIEQLEEELAEEENSDKGE